MEAKGWIATGRFDDQRRTGDACFVDARCGGERAFLVDAIATGTRGASRYFLMSLRCTG